MENRGALSECGVLRCLLRRAFCGEAGKRRAPFFCEQGRSAVLTTDCAPHWAPPEFCEWEGYERLFANLAAWLIK